MPSGRSVPLRIFMRKELVCAMIFHSSNLHSLRVSGCKIFAMKKNIFIIKIFVKKQQQVMPVCVYYARARDTALLTRPFVFHIFTTHYHQINPYPAVSFRTGCSRIPSSYSPSPQYSGFPFRRDRYKKEVTGYLLPPYPLPDNRSPTPRALWDNDP